MFYQITVKPVFFACPLFREFRDPDEFAKITGRKYIYFSSSLLAQTAKTPKLRPPK